MGDERRYPPFAIEALDEVREPVAASDTGLSIAKVVELFTADEQFTDAGAEYVLEVLQSRAATSTSLTSRSTSHRLTIDR